MASESGCPIEMHRIKIEKCDPMYDRDCRGGRTMPFYRSAYDQSTGQSPNLPREQLNRVTSWIDGSFIYSTSETWLNTMRSFNGRGTFKMVDKSTLSAAGSGDSHQQAGSGASAGALGDAYLHETVSALIADSIERRQDQDQDRGGSGSGQDGSMSSIDLTSVPMSLYGYPVRNKQRAPLINHMPAHHLQMKKAERMFLLGDPRTNQNPMILSFGILFYRWHNVLAERIHAQHPDWSDEEIFQRARRLVIASLQNIFLYEYLPILLDTPAPYQQQQASGNETTSSAFTSQQQQQKDLIALYTRGASLSDSQYDQNDLIRPYSGYKPDLHPGISHAFQSSAFRFGHTMIPPGLYLRDDQCNFMKTAQGYKGVRLCSTWWNAEEVVSRVGIEQLLMGGASQIAEREDYVLCNDVRDKLYGPLEFSRRDLAALNIMRGRDNGLADYNTIRQAFKLSKIVRWRDINPQLYDKQPALFDELARLYKNRLDNIDLYIGGMLESDLERGRPGPLFRRIIKEQFERLRDSDRFWFENPDSGIFSEAEIAEIRQIKLYDIIVNSTLIPDSAIQRDVFQFKPNQDPCPQPGQLSSSELQPCYIVKGHSYFKGSEQTYLLVCLTLIAIPILCAACAYLVVEYQDHKRRQFKAKQEYERNMAASRQHSTGAATSTTMSSGGGGGGGRGGAASKQLTGITNSAFVRARDDDDDDTDATGAGAGDGSSSSSDTGDDDATDHRHHNGDKENNQKEALPAAATSISDDKAKAEKKQQNKEKLKKKKKAEAIKSKISDERQEKCEKIYAKEWLHSNLKRKIKLRLGPAPDETLYVLDRMCQVQRKLDLNQPDCSTIVVEVSTSNNCGGGGGAVNGSGGRQVRQPYSLISAVAAAPQHPLKAAVGSAGVVIPTAATAALSLISGNGGASSSGHLSTISGGGGGDSGGDANSNGAKLQPIAPTLLTADDLDEPVDHKPMALIRVVRNCDLVLQFSSVQHRRKFIFKLQAYLRTIHKSMTLYRVQRDIMLANAETKEKRKQRLEQFFREAYALTFGFASSSGGASGGGASADANQDGNAAAAVSPDIGLVMRTSLSRQEFAEALGMRNDSLFVRQMFNCIDKDRNGQISFQEFLDLVVKFSRGKTDDKLRIVFDMCDHTGRGLIDKLDLIRMLRSLVGIAKTKSLSEQRVMELISDMFKSVGLENKQLLDYQDFKLIINNNHRLGVAGSLDNMASGDQHQQQQQQQLFGANKHNLDDSLFLPIGLDMKGAKKNFFSASAGLPNVAALGVGGGGGGVDGDDNDHLGGTLGSSRHRRMTIVDTGVGGVGGANQHNSGSAAAAARAHQQLLDTKNNKNGLKQFGQVEQLAKRSSSSASPSPLDKRLLRTVGDKWKSFATELEEHRQDIVYLLMFYVIVTVLFLERFVNYSFLSEHMDLRHVMGVGIAITRGSAASLSFCYAMLLLSMCRNLMTWIRTMSVREYIPLDSHVKFHKIVALTALVMSVLHTVGHCVNFYHVTQQPVEHLRCLTKEMQFSGESRPTFFYWVFQTVTGATGLALWILCSIVYVFAHQQVRQRAYSFFWSTHKLYYLIYALTLLHGSSKLTGSPRFWIFFIIPAILFTIDKIMSLQAKLWQLEIFETECLPSDVISIKFARPPSFQFLSGQWVRVACTAFRPHEFHAFTLTSAPQDDFLSIHVRAQGPWTWKLRNLFDPANMQYYNRHADNEVGGGTGNDKLAALHDRMPPRIRIEGPFGGGNQDWYKYEVAVMIGGGIGVTPYASILNDLVFGTSTNRYSSVQYKKVYFIWICPSHRNFEWFIDVLRDVERKDVTNLLEMHIFITQFFHKFDLRTTMLYICENHFQRISNKSLFTGLKAVNHFGRPDIAALLQQVQNRHSRVSKVGVFSCGPKPLTKSVTEACEKVNKRRKLPFFLHQYENFS